MFNKKRIEKLEGMFRELENRHQKLLEFLNIEGEYINHYLYPYHLHTGGLNQELIKYRKKLKPHKESRLTSRGFTHKINE